MKTYFGANCDQNFGRCTLTCHSNFRWFQNVSIDGIVMNRNCYTYPLILPEVTIDDPENEGQVNPKATSLNCLDYDLVYDDAFVKECATTTLHAVFEHHKATLKALDEELAPPPTAPTVNCRELRISKYFDDLCDDDHFIQDCK